MRDDSIRTREGRADRDGSFQATRPETLPNRVCGVTRRNSPHRSGMSSFCVPRPQAAHENEPSLSLSGTETSNPMARSGSSGAPTSTRHS